ncbi:MAG: tetratricopeptide repeat protein, partial [Polyangiaceae bacterium]
MSDDVESLIAQERLPEAAEILATRGDHARASLLFERACNWEKAAALALEAGDFSRALELAIVAKNESISNLALAEVGSDRAASLRCAERLALRGDHAWAARLYEAAEEKRQAALAWNRAGDAARAAEILEENGEPAEAARLLEAALRRSPDNWRSALALGGLLLRYGKAEGATRALQSIAHAAPERGPALALLVQAFEHMGLSGAARQANEELTALGGVFANATPTAARVETKS